MFADDSTSTTDTSTDTGYTDSEGTPITEAEYNQLNAEADAAAQSAQSAPATGTAPATSSSGDGILNTLSQLVDIGGKAAAASAVLKGKVPTTIPVVKKPVAATSMSTTSWVLLGFGGLLLLGVGIYAMSKPSAASVAPRA